MEFSTSFNPLQNTGLSDVNKSGAGTKNENVSPLGARDSVAFGQQGLTTDESINIVYERAMEKLQQVVADARAELGFEPGEEIDTSAEATARRIVDFALGAFERFHENHAELSEDDARQEFASFIGAAIEEGIGEARDILTSLNALSGEVDDKVNTIADIIRERLDAFAAGGVAEA